LTSSDFKPEDPHKKCSGVDKVIDVAFHANGTLLVGVQTRVCALPLLHVIETMRPLPVEPIAGTPSFVQGISVIRGFPTPVIDLGVLLGASACIGSRYVTLRLNQRQVALSVERVIGVRELNAATIMELPPLLHGASQDVIEAIGTLDEQVLVILNSGWELPDEVLRAMGSCEEHK
jgi:purine-binding chemotaxis protein CheW